MPPLRRSLWLRRLAPSSPHFRCARGARPSLARPPRLCACPPACPRLRQLAARSGRKRLRARRGGFAAPPLLPLASVVRGQRRQLAAWQRARPRHGLPRRRTRARARRRAGRRRAAPPAPGFLWGGGGCVLRRPRRGARRTASTEKFTIRSFTFHPRRSILPEVKASFERLL